jgi:hypothetical protein
MTPKESAALIRQIYSPNVIKLHLVTKQSGLEGATLKTGYWLIGLLGELEIGKPIKVTRLANFYNPGGMCGEFTSTPIVCLDESDPAVTVVGTENSLYRIEEI